MDISFVLDDDVVGRLRVADDWLDADDSDLDALVVAVKAALPARALRVGDLVERADGLDSRWWPGRVLAVEGDSVWVLDAGGDCVTWPSEGLRVVADV